MSFKNLILALRAACRLAFAILALAGGAVLVSNGNPQASDSISSGQPIEITADQLVSHGQENYAEFIGNVEAVQGNFTIRSDKLRIYYRRAAGGSPKAAPGAESIERITANGNVRIFSESRRAETDRAEYRVEDETVVLSGENSLVTDGKNTLTGSKITWNRVSGQISVEGGEQHRVKAVFFSIEKPAKPSGGSDIRPENPPAD